MLKGWGGKVLKKFRGNNISIGLSRNSFPKETIQGTLESLLEVLEVSNSHWAIRRIETKSKACVVGREVWKAE